jgi:hypothetical protein
LATQHFIETILLFGVVILLDFIQRKYIKHKINNSKKYDNLDKEILLNYFNYFNEK